MTELDQIVTGAEAVKQLRTVSIGARLQTVMPDATVRLNAHARVEERRQDRHDALASWWLGSGHLHDANTRRHTADDVIWCALVLDSGPCWESGGD